MIDACLAAGVLVATLGEPRNDGGQEWLEVSAESTGHALELVFRSPEGRLMYGDQWVDWKVHLANQIEAECDGEGWGSADAHNPEGELADDAARQNPEREGWVSVPPAHPAGWLDGGNGVFLPPVLLDIRFCESRDDYTAANPRSTARGGYQFLTGSWEWYGHAERYGVSSADQATPAQQDEAALLTWQQDGERPWYASRHCWG